MSKPLTKNGNILKRRREGALKRLQSQLIDGTKITNARGDKNMQVAIPLTDSDIKRINREIEILKDRI